MIRSVVNERSLSRFHAVWLEILLSQKSFCWLTYRDATLVQKPIQINQNIRVFEVADGSMAPTKTTCI